MKPVAPWRGVSRLLIDGNNLLHRVSGSVDEGAQRLLLARLQGVLPPDVHTIVMLDGHPARGTSRRQRVTRNLEIHHAGSLSADDALLYVVRDVPAQDRASVTLVTDDRTLTERARHLGSRTQRLAWLEGTLAAGPGSVSAARIGTGRPPPRPPEEREREPWQPGRGATRKRGNPRRQRR